MLAITTRPTRPADQHAIAGLSSISSILAVDERPHTSGSADPTDQIAVGHPSSRPLMADVDAASQPGQRIQLINMLSSIHQAGP